MFILKNKNGEVLTWNANVIERTTEDFGYPRFSYEGFEYRFEDTTNSKPKGMVLTVANQQDAASLAMELEAKTSNLVFVIRMTENKMDKPTTNIHSWMVAAGFSYLGLVISVITLCIDIGFLERHIQSDENFYSVNSYGLLNCGFGIFLIVASSVSFVMSALKQTAYAKAQIFIGALVLFYLLSHMVVI